MTIGLESHTELTLEEEADQLFNEHDIISKGHFVYTDGQHGETYICKDRIIRDTEVLKSTCRLMAERIIEEYLPGDIDYFVATAPCASQIASRTAEYVADRWVQGPRLAFAERVSEMEHNVRDGYGLKEELKFKRGFDAELVGKKVLLFEDVINSGKTFLELAHLVGEIDGLGIVGGACIFDRSPSEVDTQYLGVPKLVSLVSREFPKYSPSNLPESLRQKPVNTDLGHGALFLAQQQPKL